MKAIYRGMDRATLDAAYNNRAAVRDYPAISAARIERRAQVQRRSPIRDLPGTRASAVVAAGAAELPELVRQSSEYAQALGLAPLLLPGHDHFTVLDELARPEGVLCDALQGLVARAGQRPRD